MSFSFRILFERGHTNIWCILCQSIYWRSSSLWIELPFEMVNKKQFKFWNKMRIGQCNFLWPAFLRIHQFRMPAESKQCFWSSPQWKRTTLFIFLDRGYIEKWGTNNWKLKVTPTISGLLCACLKRTFMGSNAATMQISPMSNFANFDVFAECTLASSKTNNDIQDWVLRQFFQLLSSFSFASSQFYHLSRPYYRYYHTIATSWKGQ